LVLAATYAIKSPMTVQDYGRHLGAVPDHGGKPAVGGETLRTRRAATHLLVRLSFVRCSLLVSTAAAHVDVVFALGFPYQPGFAARHKRPVTDNAPCSHDAVVAPQTDGCNREVRHNSRLV